MMPATFAGSGATMKIRPARGLVWACLGAALTVSGCTLHDRGGVGYADNRGSIVNQPSDEALYLGNKHYRNGDFGLAENFFRQSVETNPRNPAGWIGLAASYDRLRRFDLAERAYQHALKLTGNSPMVLNNLGYHHLLRGNLNQARRYLVAASEKDPENPRVLNNLALLEERAANHGQPVTAVQ